MSALKGLSRLTSFALISLLSVSTLHAARPGYYVGGQAGWGNLHDFGISDGDLGLMINKALGYTPTVTAFSGTNSDNGFAWRVFGGFQFGYNWAAEIGWSQYTNLSVDVTAAGFDQVTGLPFLVGTSSGIFKTTVFDAVGKFIYPFPFCCRMNVYAKLGAAFVTGKTTPILDVDENDVFIGAGEDPIIAKALFPTASIGFTYDLRTDIAMDISYNRIQKIGHTDQLGSLDSVMLAMSLHFG